MAPEKRGNIRFETMKKDTLGLRGLYRRRTEAFTRGLSKGRGCGSIEKGVLEKRKREM